MSRIALAIGWIFLTAVGCLTAVGWAACAAAAESRPPNILLLLTDDQRWDTLGAAGNRIIQTPNLDRLARNGVMFRNAYCTTSICAINRATILTGQYALRHGVNDFQTPLAGEALAQTFPLLLRKAGYRTGFIGKWGLGGPLPRDQFDYWAGFGGQGRYFSGDDSEHLTDKMGRQALEFLDGCTPQQPFLLQVSFKAPHCQDGEKWQFPHAERHKALYADVSIDPPPTATEEHFRRLPPFLQTSEARRRWHLRFEPDIFQPTVKDYYRLITGVDDVVGQIVERLHARDLAANTVIVFTSDNGFYLGDHGLAGKWFMHEQSIRVPLFIHDPRLPAARQGASVDVPALSIDLAPTLVDLAGLAPPATMQGRSLGPLCRENPPADWRREWFYEHRFRVGTIPQTEGVHTGRWKYVRYVSIQPVFEELFDLEADPHEEVNLAAQPQHADMLERMRASWRALRRKAE
jgi:arylsulfatase A-like enzyme